MIKKVIFSLFALAIFLSCEKEEDNTNEASLENYIESHSSLTPLNELIACAAGGQETFLMDETFPLNMFFYPELEAYDFKYYETENSDDDPDDLSLFIEKTATDVPVMNGFLRRYPLPAPEKEVWARVSYIAGDTLWYCKPVRIKYNDQPSEFAPELCDVDLSTPTEPVFTWQDGTADDNIIYFQIISKDGEALSGTYTEEKSFQYYNLDNVVLNVTRAGQAQALQADSTYTFTLMGVSADNWVNLIMEKSFVVQ